MWWHCSNQIIVCICQKKREEKSGLPFYWQQWLWFLSHLSSLCSSVSWRLPPSQNTPLPTRHKHTQNTQMRISLHYTARTVYSLISHIENLLLKKFFHLLSNFHWNEWQKLYIQYRPPLRSLYIPAAWTETGQLTWFFQTAPQQWSHHCVRDNHKSLLVSPWLEVKICQTEKREKLKLRPNILLDITARTTYQMG